MVVDAGNDVDKSSLNPNRRCFSLYFTLMHFEKAWTTYLSSPAEGIIMVWLGQ